MKTWALVVFVLGGATSAEEITRIRLQHPGEGKEATQLIQQALDSDANEVVLSADGGHPWISGPLFVRRDNLRLTLAPGTVLRGQPGAFLGKEDALLTVEKRRGFTLVAHGAELVMAEEEFADGEHRHCLNLRSVERVRIHGGTYARSGGDGIYLGTRDGRRINDDIVITDVLCRANRRQGMSVTCASRLTLRDCLFLDTRGTAPEAGLDFEPNHEGDFFQACVVSHCLAIHNAAQGFENHFNRLRATSQAVDITFDHCYAEGGTKYGFTILASDPRATAPPGRLSLKNCVARRNGTAGIRTRNGASGALRAIVEDSFIFHTGSTDRRAPLWVLAQDGSTAPHGDAEFRRLHITDSDPRPPVLVTLQGSAASHGLGEFSGTLRILNPVAGALSAETRRWLPNLELESLAQPAAQLHLHGPLPGTRCHRGDSIPIEVSASEVAKDHWRLRLEVFHDAKRIHQSESSPSQAPAWQSGEDLAAGVYSLWLTLTDPEGRVHDRVATAVQVLP